jgi:phosphatidate cytidylyltransferase
MAVDIELLFRVAGPFALLYLAGGLATFKHAQRLPGPAGKAIRNKFLVYLTVSGLTILAICTPPLFTPMAIAVALLGLLEVVRLRGSRRPDRWIATAAYLLLAIGFVMFSTQASAATVLITYGAVVTFDGFSQVFGQRLGRTKIAPSVSPNKTLEGAVGGALGAGVYLLLVSHSHFSLSQLLSLIVTLLAALFGDLLASAWKRRSGVKDYGTLIPYHGGVLDRFDSFLVASCAGFGLIALGAGLQ